MEHFKHYFEFLTRNFFENPVIYASTFVLILVESFEMAYKPSWNFDLKIGPPHSLRSPIREDGLDALESFMIIAYNSTFQRLLTVRVWL